ncbi:hypothetical protein GCM10009660_04750 [Catellatospora bangladeshensis]
MRPADVAAEPRRPGPDEPARVSGDAPSPPCATRRATGPRQRTPTALRSSRTTSGKPGLKIVDRVAGRAPTRPATLGVTVQQLPRLMELYASLCGNQPLDPGADW